MACKKEGKSKKEDATQFFQPFAHSVSAPISIWSIPIQRAKKTVKKASIPTFSRKGVSEQSYRLLKDEVF
jgi:hypothetical protein